MHTIRFVAATSLALAVVASGHVSGRATTDALVIFGTSLSDPGNAFALAGGTNTPPDFSVDPLLVPDRPYARGGHHFTNGSTWVEQLAQDLGIGGSANPAFTSANPHALNFAVGGARARPGTTSVDLPTQVGLFLQRTGGVASPDALYVVEMGVNDVRDALRVALGGLDPMQVLQSASASIADNVSTLHAAGARKFLIWNSPDVALTPAILGLDQSFPGVGGLTSTLTAGFNSLLDAELAQLNLADLDVVRLDAFQLLHQIVEAPASFGLRNVTTACINPGVAPFVCQEPGDFLFWDGIHPSQAGHVILADEARILLGS